MPPSPLRAFRASPRPQQAPRLVVGHPRKSRSSDPTLHAPKRLEQEHASRLAILLEETSDALPDAFGDDPPADIDFTPSPWSQDRIVELNDEQDSFIPVPIPDTSVPTSAPIILDYGAITSFPTQTSHFALSTTIKSPSVFSALPALPSHTSAAFLTSVSSGAAFPTSSMESYSSVAQVNNALDRSSQHHQKIQSPHKVSTVVIVLLAIGAGCIVLGLFFITRVCWRPHRRTRPLPSLPMPNDAYGDDKLHPPDSPLFGGNERFSMRSAIVSIPTWTPYPRPKLDDQLSHAGTSTTVVHKPDVVATGSDIAVSNTIGGSNCTPSCSLEGLHRDSCIASQTPANSPRQAPLAQLQGALARAATRVSMASLSLYPNSPLPPENMGIALGGPTAFTADGHRVLDRTRSKASLHRSRSNSLIEEACEQDRMYYRNSHGLAYDGADVSSPSIATRIHAHPAHVISTPPAIPVSGGRARIKSAYYAPGAYPRVSTLPSFPGKPRMTPETPETQHPLQSTPDTRQDRSAAAALTYALGLHSPAEYSSTSPRPTLYPDDSVSIAGSRRTAKDNCTHKRGISEVGDGHLSLPPLATELDTSSLGSLMLMDYNHEKPPEEGPIQILSRNAPSASYGSTKRDDKPPRVPSPPPLPSLSQMALEHANPQAYAEYRSPTYSIFGLYEHERKSKAMSNSSSRLVRD
ncbi:hypothetical protein AX16_008804 [Volvariella volvacea WC 439]|nr:hypothetical protein AX16_008804 [Volvariella volvacea WC 439]